MSRFNYFNIAKNFGFYDRFRHFGENDWQDRDIERFFITFVKGCKYISTDAICVILSHMVGQIYPQLREIYYVFDYNTIIQL